jgi:LysR family transcriptional regulator, hydrogen peroxide-inducible genes activator
MELHQLQYVVAVAEEASFSRAAGRLGLAQPSLSQQIKKLESEIGQPLFDRLPRGAVPTQAGEQLLQHARRVLSELAEAKRRVGDSAGHVSGTLTVGAIPTIAPFVLPSALRAFSARHAGVDLHVVEDVTDRLVEMLERGSLDVAIISARDGSRTVHVERLADEPLYLLLPRDHRLARRKAANWEELRGERFLVLHEMHCLAGQVSQVCHHKGLRPPVVMRGAQLATIAAMVSCGLGVSVVPAMMARANCGTPPPDGRPKNERDGCVYLPFDKDPPRRDLAAAWGLLRYRTNASRAFVDVLGEMLRGRDVQAD